MKDQTEDEKTNVEQCPFLAEQTSDNLHSVVSLDLSKSVFLQKRITTGLF
jgi:hypothetical protein